VLALWPFTEFEFGAAGELDSISGAMLDYLGVHEGSTGYQRKVSECAINLVKIIRSE
jgi:hypothetical protein